MIQLHNKRITIIHDDALIGMRQIKSNVIHMTFNDLPYGTTANKWDSLIDLDQLWCELQRISIPTTNHVFTASGGFQFTLYNSNPTMYKYDWVWDKIIPSGMSYARFQPMRRHEYVLVFYDQKGVYNAQTTIRDVPIKSGGQKNLNSDSTTLDHYKVAGFTKEYTTKQPTTIISFMKVRRNSLHRTQKPIDLVEYLIKTYTNENDVVLDPTMGSGTTAIACINTNRRFIGIEKDESIFIAAKNRIVERINDDSR